MTRAVREVIQLALDGCADMVPDWLQEVAKTDKGRAIDLYVKLAEFAIPKLTRAEVKVTPPGASGPERVYTQEEAASVYERILKGEVDPSTVRIERAALPAIEGPAVSTPQSEQIAVPVASGEVPQVGERLRR